MLSGFPRSRMQMGKLFIAVLAGLLFGCKSGTQNPVKLVTLDPGHFHAALVQKSMYPEVDSTVYVFAPEGNDLQWHLDRINSYNTRTENPTHWKEVVYRGDDFFEKFLSEKKGTVVVVAGNNRLKTDYILKSLTAGYHVLADKPMVIHAGDFEKLKQALAVAKEKKLVLLDIMTERFEITNALVRELAMNPKVFGTLLPGTPEDPSVKNESIHHFYKNVSGKPLVRPAWFMDVNQQGEGIVDVTTHLVDLVQWTCFPDQVLDTTDVKIISAVRTPTLMSLPEFSTITQLNAWPGYLLDKVVHDTLHVMSNGVINYNLKGVHVQTAVKWNYEAPAGSGDAHYSLFKGSLATLEIRQTAAEGNKPVLYIQPVSSSQGYGDVLKAAIDALQSKYPGISLVQSGNDEWAVQVPAALSEGHEAHFGRVMEKFLTCLKTGSVPDWEAKAMMVKYYTTTRALELR